MALRIAIWNCNMRLHDKSERLRALGADVAVVPECACPEVLYRRSAPVEGEQLVWRGRNPAKGLGVFASLPFRLRPLSGPYLRSAAVIPALVSGRVSFRLLAIWAGARREPHEESLLGSVRRLRSFLCGSPTIVAGDFNDTLRRSGKLFRELETAGLISAYHLDRGLAHGEEREPTYCRYRRPGGRLHLDHLFVDRRAARRIRRVELGRPEDWIDLSDHVPLVVELDLGGRESGRRPVPWT